MKPTPSLLVIGGGHMGGAIALRWQHATLGSVHVVEPEAAKRAALSAEGVTCYATLAEAPKNTTALLLAIKPQQFTDFIPALSAHLAGSETLLISIMAGIPLAMLQNISPYAVRVMPNLPALIGESMSVACAPALDEKFHALTTLLFETVGQILWVEDEEMLHAATAISGSGPGYVFAFMEAFEIAAQKQGFSTDISRQLVRQTFLGAAKLAHTSNESASQLAENVASRGGTTEAALRILAEKDLKSLLQQAAEAAAIRSRELSK